MSASLLEYVTDVLPHGSGINCDWSLEMKRDRLIASNSYHVMNENGYYVGYADFSLAMTLDDAGELQFDRLTFHGRDSHYLARYYSLRDYLEEALAMALAFYGDDA